MTLKEEAYALIDKLPDKVMEDVVQMLRVKASNKTTWEPDGLARQRKIDALRDLQLLRSDARKFGSIDCALAREEAIFEKYGV